MKAFLQMMCDRQTTVLTLPDLEFDSLHDQNLLKLGTLFRQTARRLACKTLILDVAVVRSTGAAFLTEVNRFAQVLREKQVQIVIAGEARGLFQLVGWQKRFRLYPSLSATLLDWAAWSLPEDSTDTSPSERARSQIRIVSSACVCAVCRNGRVFRTN